MRYYKSTTGEVYGYDTDQQHLIDAAVKNGWEDITGNWPPAPMVDTAAHALAACKIAAKKKLLDTDYTQLTDVAATLANKTDFDEYRSAVRILYLNPVENPVWPAVPDPIWKNNQ